MKKLLTVAAFAVITLYGHSGAMAQTYLSVGAGATSLNLDCTGVSDCDNKDTGGKLVLGYGFSNGLAIEASAFSYGKAKATDVVDSTRVRAELAGSGVGLGVAYLGSLSEKWVYGARAGVAFNRTKISGSAAGVSFSDKDSNAQAYVGIGLAYKFSPTTSVGIDLDTTRFEYSGEKASARMISAVARFDF